MEGDLLAGEESEDEEGEFVLPPGHCWVLAGGPAPLWGGHAGRGAWQLPPLAGPCERGPSAARA
jgi:hypothetical protein